MPLSVAQVQSMTNGALKNFVRGKMTVQDVQDKPFLRELYKRKKTFTGGKGLEISEGVRGNERQGFQGYSYDDTVTFTNPASLKRANFFAREHHVGLNITYTELKEDGIIVNDNKMNKIEAAEVHRLANITDEKMDEMKETFEDGLTRALWSDGTINPKEVAGVRSFIVDDPTTATTVAGIDQSANSWWQNRAALNIDSTVANASSNNLIRRMQKEWRQACRYGSKPTHIFAGADFIEAYETELRAKGNYSESGFTGKLDGGVGELAFKGMPVIYDPYLDTLGRAKYAYMLDLNRIRMRPLQGDFMQEHTPARPEDKFVFYKSLTATVALTCKQRNSSVVFSIA